MDVFTLISALKLCSIITGALAILCLIPAILITRKSTPTQLKNVIEADRISHDPRHRKAVHWLPPEEKEKLDGLLSCSNSPTINGWHGHCPGKEKRI